MPSASLYETFGNEVKYSITEGTLHAYLENSTIAFPLPEAASDILAGYVSFDKSIDGQLLDQVTQKLIVAGFKKAKATTTATATATATVTATATATAIYFWMFQVLHPVW